MDDEGEVNEPPNLLGERQRAREAREKVGEEAWKSWTRRVDRGGGEGLRLRPGSG